MKLDLSVYDVSAYVYAGMSNSNYENRKFINYPVGGIQYLMKYVVSDLKAGKFVALAFDSRSFRKDLMKEYKAGRVPDYRVYSQLEFLYEYLNKCGIACYKKQGYEADDLIYNIVNQNKANHLQTIIYGTDYDLTHNVDERRVRFGAATNIVNSISPINFATSIVKGELIFFNTISAYKVFVGDHSDNIPAFKSARGLTGKALYNKFVQLITKSSKPLTSEQTKSRTLLEWYIKQLDSILFDVDKQELKRRMDIVFPVELNDDFTYVSNEKSINMELLKSFLVMVNDNTTLKSLGGYGTVTDEMKMILGKRAKELETGEFAVDRNKVVSAMPANTFMLNLKEF